MAVTATQVESLYLAYFGRPAEPAGLSYWTSQTNATVDQISAAFAQQPEYTNTYGGLTRTQVVNTLYQNLFGRSAASNELNYWVNSTDVTVDRLALALTNGATGTDRLLLDSKVQYSNSVTTSLASTATASDAKAALNSATIISSVSNGTPTTQTLSAYLTANTTKSAADFYTLAAAQAANTTKFALSGTALTDANGVTAASVNFGASVTAGSIALTNVSGAASVGLAAANKATDLTLAGTSGLATGSAATTSITLTEAASTKIVSALHLNITDSAVANTTTTVGVSGLTALTSIDASGSSAALTIDSSTLASVATVNGGSGVDTLTVATTATNAVAQTVNAGAGADVVGATVGTAALTVNGGAGNDVITANVTSSSAAVLTINAGDGNDTVKVNDAYSASTATHGLSINLGNGSDVVDLVTLTNVGGTVSLANSAAIATTNANISANLVKVADFAGSSDVVHLATGSVFTALNNSQAANVTASASLAEAANAALQAAHTNATGTTATSFVYGGNTYVALDTAPSGGATGTLTAGDGLIELTGFTGSLTQGTNVTIG